jgi:trigger factor
LKAGFEEGLVGAKKGETREIKVEFPTDYNAADVAGKKAVFTVHVTEIREIQLPAVDDEFAKSLGGVDTVAAMREAISKAVGSAKERSRRLRLQDQVATQLLEKYPVSVPQAMVEAELGMLVDREVANLRGQGMEPKGDDGLKAVAEQLKPMAEKRARLSLILESVADAQKMTVSEEEFEADMAKAAPQLGMTLSQTVAWVKQNGRESSVKSRLREEKALSYLIDKASIKDE